MKTITYTQFDIPKQHLPEQGPHYRLPAEHTRQALYEQELRGSTVAWALAETLRGEEVDDGGFTERLIAMAAFNSAWYNYDGIDESMRHVVKVPSMLAADRVTPASRDDLLAGASGHFESAMGKERRLTGILARGAEVRSRLHFDLGRSLAGASLNLAALRSVDTSQHADRLEARRTAREDAFAIAQSARDLATRIGTFPSLAQVGTESSELMMHIRRDAPRAAIELFDSVL